MIKEAKGSSSLFNELITTFESPSIMIEERPISCAKHKALIAIKASTPAIVGGKTRLLDIEAETSPNSVPNYHTDTYFFILFKDCTIQIYFDDWGWGRGGEGFATWLE